MAKRNFSSKRNAIYNAICSTDTHPSARWVYDKLKPDFPDLSLGTVYRNMSMFKDDGKISVICNVFGEDRVDGNTSPHTHFVCECCGNVYDVNGTDDLTADQIILEKQGFKVESKFVIYHGKCSKCS